jgi:Sec-independent protein translocase protein TatA
MGYPKNFQNSNPVDGKSSKDPSERKYNPKKYEPPTYPQYSPDPTKEELVRAMLDSDETIQGPGIGEALLVLPPGRAAKAATGAAKAAGKARKAQIDRSMQDAIRQTQKKNLPPSTHRADKLAMHRELRERHLMKESQRARLLRGRKR